MIQPNEIRIGNWVMHNGKAYQTTSIYVYNPINADRYVLVRLNTEQGVNTNDLYPIPLTEDRMIKLGAEKYTPDNTYKLDGIIIDLKLGIAMLDCENCTPLLGICKYLHQLQNIYFIRKNKELEIEL
ncbi:hypothetical protein [Dysgonomonas massiliensis]|uniref:hypothetical protein n=1 Tax=Dysgonomonas massiliensis TaxID=2040292 RepID=UPI000C78E80D|nr:hypothetical protein [Dysgonomonas massiliensis]